MTFLVYIRSLRGPSPRIIYDESGGKPVYGEAERAYAIPGVAFRLTAAEESGFIAREIGLDDLIKRYPPPRGREEPPQAAPTPKSPAPKSPKPGAAAEQREVA